jgi:MATE family multidrug resistance protein
VLQIALPLVISMMSWTVMHFCDRLFLFWYSKKAVAAALPSGMVHFTMLCLPMGITGYVTTFVAQYLGAKRESRIGLAVWQGIWIGAIATPIFLLTIPLAPFIFQIAGHTEEIVRLEAGYFVYSAYGAGGVIISVALSSFFTGLGRTRVVMVVDALASSLDIVLNYLLIFGKFGFPELGIVGAAVTTSISQWVKVVIYAWLIRSREFALYEIRNGCRFDPPLFRRILRYGGPSGVQMFIETTAFTTFLLIMGQIGPDALAATTVAFSINSIAFVPLLGLGMAVTTIVGQQLGANLPDMAARATWASLALGAIYTGTLAVMYVVVPDLFLIFHALGSDPSQYNELRDTNVILLRFVALYCMMDMVHIVFVSAIKGAGDTRFVLLVTCVLSPVPVVIGWLGRKFANWQLIPFWIVLTLWIFALGIAYFLRFRQGEWRSMRVIEHDDNDSQVFVATDNGSNLPLPPSTPQGDYASGRPASRAVSAEKMVVLTDPELPTTLRE